MLGSMRKPNHYLLADMCLKQMKETPDRDPLDMLVRDEIEDAENPKSLRQK